LKEFGLLRGKEIGVGIQTITQRLAAVGLELKSTYVVIIFPDVLPGGPAEGAG